MSQLKLEAQAVALIRDLLLARLKTDEKHLRDLCEGERRREIGDPQSLARWKETEEAEIALIQRALVELPGPTP